MKRQAFLSYYEKKGHEFRKLCLASHMLTTSIRHVTRYIHKLWSSCAIFTSSKCYCFMFVAFALINIFDAKHMFFNSVPLKYSSKIVTNMLLLVVYYVIMYLLVSTPKGLVNHFLISLFFYEWVKPIPYYLLRHNGSNM